MVRITFPDDGITLNFWLNEKVNWDISIAACIDSD
jgi:hypothetical protein